MNTFSTWSVTTGRVLFTISPTVLANHNVNVRELETVVEAASMGGGELFRARAELLVPVSTDIDAARKRTRRPGQ